MTALKRIYDCIFGKRCYKVMHKGNVSLVVSGYAEVWYRRWKLNGAPSWLQLQGYHLTAFENIRAAKEFAHPVDGDTIWECRGYRQIKELPTMCGVFSLAEGRLVRRKASHWPKWTVMYEYLLLVRRVG